MSSRLERKLGETMRMYDALPEEFRARLEAALAQAKEVLSVSEEIKILAPDLRGLLFDCAAMIFADGQMGGNWNKVHAAIAAAMPRLYGQVADLIPRSDSLSDVGL